MRCLAAQTQLEAIETRHEARRIRERVRPVGIPGPGAPVVETRQSLCPLCGLSLLNAVSVLFQGDQLVHALCWRADPPQFDARQPAE
jgi:hypothetical protein